MKNLTFILLCITLLLLISVGYLLQRKMRLKDFLSRSIKQTEKSIKQTERCKQILEECIGYCEKSEDEFWQDYLKKSCAKDYHFPCCFIDTDNPGENQKECEEWKSQMVDSFQKFKNLK